MHLHFFIYSLEFILVYGMRNLYTIWTKSFSFRYILSETKQIEINIVQLLTMDISALVSMKNAANCDT
jgi:hypothetical protein